MRIAFLIVGLAMSVPAQTVFVEAESFRSLGGWKIDTATTLNVGSPYLLAHGLGRPVADATTRIEVPRGARYRVWVRTRDWVAPWRAPGKPGRFEFHIDGARLEAEFGTQSADWHWQDGGTLELTRGTHRLALHDVTGFAGRCDAILFDADPSAKPPNGEALAAARRRWLDAEEPKVHAGYDLVVVGGGYAGLAAAIAAARQSLRVALIQDRFVLGGNGSSEVRVWANGGTMRGLFPRLGEIVEEFADHAPDSPGAGKDYGDSLKERVCRGEKSLDLYLGHFANAVQKDGNRIVSITALDVRSGQTKRFEGKLFADCTGHGTIGALAGADYEMKPDGRMGMSNMWFWQNRKDAPSWPETPWALPLEIGDFPRTPGSHSRIEGKRFFKGEWFWESGFDAHPIRDLEQIRDWNLRAVFGAFSALKKSGKYPNASLEWVAYVGGTRESRLLRGDVVLSREHIVEKRQFKDGCVATTWDIDLHYPKEKYAKKFPGNPFISRAEFGAGVDRKEGFPVPYRCFYSRNLDNLFMAGRCISVTHEALGTVRVMRTCGMMGEVVGRAAWVCVRHEVDPRGVYSEHLAVLLDLLRQPGAMRRDSLTAALARDPTIGTVHRYSSKGEDRKRLAAPGRAAVGIAAASLKGLVVDDADAELAGTWRTGGLSPFVGSGYRYANGGAKATARFAFAIRKAGRYEVRVAWVGHENRGKRVPCRIERAGKRPLRLRIDQTTAGDGGALFRSVGRFAFPVGAAAVVLSAQGSDGCVHADAVQLVPLQ